MTEQIMEGLRQLAEKLGTTVEFLWGVIIKQQYVEPIYGLVAFVSLLSASVLFYKVYKIAHKKKLIDPPPKYDTNTAEVMETIALVLVSITIVSAGAALVFSVMEAVDLLNPEYAALKDITSKLTNQWR